MQCWSRRSCAARPVRALPRMRRADRRRDCRSGSRLRWSRAGRCRSSRRPERDCASVSRAAAASRPAAGVAAKVARRSRTICQGGSVGGKSGDARDLAPDRSARAPRAACRSAGRAALMVTDSRPGKAKIHSRRAVEHAERSAAAPAAARSRKCALTMARNSVGTVEVAARARRPHRRHREDHGVVRRRASTVVVAEIERRDALAARTRSARSCVSEAHVDACARADKRAPARSSVGAKPVARDQRPAGLPARRERLADDRAGERAPSLPADRC